jgi:hypothetical protein
VVPLSVEDGWTEEVSGGGSEVLVAESVGSGAALEGTEESVALSVPAGSPDGAVVLSVASGEDVVDEVSGLPLVGGGLEGLLPVGLGRTVAVADAVAAAVAAEGVPKIVATWSLKVSSWAAISSRVYCVIVAAKSSSCPHSDLSEVSWVSSGSEGTDSTSWLAIAAVMQRWHW